MFSVVELLKDFAKSFRRVFLQNSYLRLIVQMVQLLFHATQQQLSSYFICYSARCNVGLRYNGCGSDAFNNDVLNTLNVGYKTTLEAACNKHDICYNCVSIIFESRRVF